ncbi:MAG TPA: hypothetical protein VH590_17210, partial [Ktedonobacterales bacterium]
GQYRPDEYALIGGSLADFVHAILSAMGTIDVGSANDDWAGERAMWYGKSDARYGKTAFRI